MTKPRVQLKIENVGPIVEGTVEFKPLTFLIGPNNSGKSYVATLLYALSRVLRGGLMYPFAPPAPDVTADATRLLPEWAQSRAAPLPRAGLPASVGSAIDAYLDRQWEHAPHRIEESLRQYLSVTDVADLRRATRDDIAELRLTSMIATGDRPLISVHSSDTKTQIDVGCSFSDSIDVPPERILSQLQFEPHLVPLTLALYVWYSFVEDHGFHHPHAYYLPAARSGVLASWPLMASLAVQSVSRVIGRQQIDIPPLPGIVGDFLQTLIEQFFPTVGLNGHSSARIRLQPVLDVLEGQLLSGRVVIEEVRPGAAQLTYDTVSLRVPIQRTSSMVAELAPIDLWVRELLEPGDLLIIDEPESHLHPENQRLIARALVRLVNAGVDVVAPTHSSTILHQVSNMLLASRADDATRAKLGFTEADRIALEDVAVYLFEPGADGIHIKEVAIDPEFGISEEEFVRVSEAIGEETLQLEFAAAQ